jgi:uncharacterized membrane protein
MNATKQRNGAKWLMWAVLSVLALFIGVYSLRYALPHVPRPSPLSNFTVRRPWLVMHAVFASLALLSGPWQFLPLGTRRRGGIHRWLGRFYLVCVALGWVASLPIAAHAQTGPIASAGFLSLGACWIVSSALAYITIRRGDVAAHRRWMVRSYALTAAAITLRVLLVSSLAGGLDFVVSYRIIAWACWVPNLMVAELWLRITRARSGQQIRVS